MARPQSAKRKKFISEFLVDRDASAAARRAGFAAKSAGVRGHLLLKDPEIQKEINSAISRISKKTEVSVAWVIEKLKRAVAINGRVYTITNRTADGGKYSKQKMVDSNAHNRALELLGKNLKMFTDVLQVQGVAGLAERLNRADSRKDA